LSWRKRDCVGECFFVVNLRFKEQKSIIRHKTGYFCSLKGESVMTSQEKLAKVQAVFLRGRKTILRPPNLEQDLHLFYKWINDPEVRRFLKVFRPTSLESEKKFIESTNGSSNSIIFTMETFEGQAIGVMSLEKIDWKNRRAVTGTFIGEKDFWGLGYATDAKMELLRYAFDELNLHKICSGAVEFNERSVAYSQKCGYRIEGREKQHIFRDGKYYDHILLAVFRKGWFNAYQKYLTSVAV
jgi:RimJ/RimL family protein N-acetyltransferase